MYGELCMAFSITLLKNSTKKKVTIFKSAKNYIVTKRKREWIRKWLEKWKARAGGLSEKFTNLSVWLSNKKAPFHDVLSSTTISTCKHTALSVCFIHVNPISIIYFLFFFVRGKWLKRDLRFLFYSDSLKTRIMLINIKNIYSIYRKIKENTCEC